MVIGVLGEMSDAPSAGEAVTAAAGSTGGVDGDGDGEVVDSAVLGAGVGVGALDDAPVAAGVETGADGLDTALLGTAAVWPDGTGAALLLPPFALLFDVHAAAASRLSDSMATVARRPHRIGWAAVNMLILGLCWR